EIHAPSSKPACTAPRMSARPSDDNRVLRVEMKVPSSTAVKPSQGIEVGGAGAVAGATAGPSAGPSAGRAVGSLIGAHHRACQLSPPPTYRAAGDPGDHPHRRSQFSRPHAVQPS